MKVRFLAALLVLPSVLLVASCGDTDTPTGPADEVSIETDSLAEAIQGQGYNQPLEATGGSGSYTWLLTGGSFPAGLNLSPGGVISGTPIAPGAASFRVRATDGNGLTGEAELSIAVTQALAIHTWMLADAVVGEAYSAQLVAVGGRGTYGWSITGGDAASWLTVTSAGALSGTPTGPGASGVTVAVTDESGQTSTRSLSVGVLDSLAVTDLVLPTGTQGRAYAAQLVATGGSGSYVWSLAEGVLPAGMELQNGGAVTGTPTDGGTYPFGAQVTDAGGRIATRSLLLTVARAPTIQTTGLPPADTGVPYTTQLEATGGTGALSWSVVGGALPPGLTLSPGGAVSGTAGALGTFNFTVQVTDEAAATHSRAFTLVVAEIVTLENGVVLTGLAGTTGSVRYFGIDVPAGATQLILSISGGTGDADLYVRRGALPLLYTYDCRPLRQGNEETCTFNAPTAGGWYVMLRGYTDYSGVALQASHGG